MNVMIKDLGWFVLKDNFIVNGAYWLAAKYLFSPLKRKEMTLNTYREHSAYKGFDFSETTNKEFVLSRVSEFDSESGLSFKGFTSGTTNAPMPVYRSLSSVIFDELSLRSHWYAQGVSFNPKIATLRGDNLFPGDYEGDVYWQVMPFSRRLIMSSFHLSPRTVSKYITELERYKPEVILAYPSVINTLSRLAKEFDWKPDWKVFVFTSGETFPASDQRQVRDVFPELYDHYGQAERVARLQQCREGKYHVVNWYSYVEFEKEGGSFKVLGTNFRNKSMPLYRYDCGDLVKGRGDKPCPCGLPSPYFDEVLGRSSNEIVLESGVRIGPAAMSLLFYGVDNVFEAQVVQLKNKDLLVKYSTFSGEACEDAEKALREAFFQRFGNVQLIMQYSNELQRNSSGKLPPIIVES